MEDAEEEVVKEKKLEEELVAGEEQSNPLALLRPIRRCNQRSRVGSVGSQSTENPLNSEAWGQSFKHSNARICDGSTPLQNLASVHVSSAPVSPADISVTSALVYTTSHRICGGEAKARTPRYSACIQSL
jgi:hypothetical protein